MVFTGLLYGRNRDSLGLGLSWSELYRGGTNQETAVELYYRAQLSPRMSLQPDIQYIASPSGIYRDALAVGTRLQVAW
jgi:carbohydrate-selective porin OprB